QWDFEARADALRSSIKGPAAGRERRQYASVQIAGSLHFLDLVQNVRQFREVGVHSLRFGMGSQILLEGTQLLLRSLPIQFGVHQFQISVLFVRIAQTIPLLDSRSLRRALALNSRDFTVFTGISRISLIS